MRHLLFAFVLICATPTFAGDLEPRAGWVVIKTHKAHTALTADLKNAVKAHKMGVATQASPTATARNRGIDIPDNRVIGVFNNDFAVKILATSTAAMIEAPIRFYITENTDGSATLAYKIPSKVFAPYYNEGGHALKNVVAELDRTFAGIAQDAIR